MTAWTDHIKATQKKMGANATYAQAMKKAATTWKKSPSKPKPNVSKPRVGRGMDPREPLVPKRPKSNADVLVKFNKEMKERGLTKPKPPKKKGNGAYDNAIAGLSSSERAELRAREQQALANATRNADGRRVVLSSSEVAAIKQSVQSQYLFGRYY